MAPTRDFEVEVAARGPLGLDLEFSQTAHALVVVAVDPSKARDERTQRAIASARAGDVVLAVEGQSVRGDSLESAAGLLREALDAAKEVARLQFRRDDTAMHPLASRIEVSLQRSPYFEPLHVELIDESSWYDARRQVGGRRHMAREIVQLRGVAADRFPRRIGYEGFYYALAPNDQTGELEPRRLSAGVAATAKQAYDLADAACAARDADAADDALGRHLRVVVVSGTFVGLDQRDRCDLVVETLLDCLDAVAPGEELAMGGWVPDRVPRGLVAGPTVYQLPFHARLTRLGAAELCLDLRTPAQWNRRRFAPEPVEVRDDRRLLPGVFALPTAKLRQARSSRHIRDLLTARSATKTQRADPVRGHFFHSLPPEHRNYLVAAQRAADAALAKAGDEGARTRTPVLGQSVRSAENEGRHAARQAAARHAAGLRRDAESARRLQRIFRRRLLRRAFRRRNRRHLAATRIQRALRRIFGALFAYLSRRLLSLAATRLASRYRVVRAVRRIRERRRRFNAAAVNIERVARGWRARRYVRWVRDKWRTATELTKVARGFLASCEYAVELVAARFVRRERRSLARFWPAARLPRTARAAVRPLAATRLQAQARRASARTKFVAALAEWRDRTVVQPARLRIQSAWRGGLSRLVARRRRCRRRAATHVQSVARGFLARRWRRDVREAAARHRAARNVQRMVRGYLDRCVAALKRREARRHFARSVLVPRVQAVARRRRATRRAAEIRVATRGALRVQRSWRTYLSVRDAVLIRDKLVALKREIAAETLQRVARGVSCRRRFTYLWHATAGHRLRAARVIFRAWRRFRARVRYDELMVEWAVERSRRELSRLAEQRAEVLRDLGDIRADAEDVRRRRQWACRRLKQLAAFILEAELRFPKIEAAVDELDGAEVEAGWGGALEREWERLESQTLMAKEERQLHLSAVRDYDAELTDLALELEDVEVDLDDVAAAEMAEFERLRRLELAQADRRAQNDKIRRVRLERARWRIRDVRTRVLDRGRRERRRLFDEAIQPHRADHAATLSFAKRTAIDRQARRQALASEAADRSRHLEASRRDSEGAVERLKATYDAIVKGCATILQSATLDMRTDKSIF